MTATSIDYQVYWLGQALWLFFFLHKIAENILNCGKWRLIIIAWSRNVLAVSVKKLRDKKRILSTKIPSSAIQFVKIEMSSMPLHTHKRWVKEHAAKNNLVLTASKFLKNKPKEKKPYRIIQKVFAWPLVWLRAIHGACYFNWNCGIFH